MVVVLIDSATPFEEQDQRIADLAEREGRAIVLAAGKWDLTEQKAGAISRLREQAEEKLTQLKGAPLVAVSGLTGEGLERLMQAILDAYAVWNKRVPTNALNRWLEGALSAHPPPAVSGRRLKFNYMTQAESASADIRIVLHARRCGAGRLQALSGQQPARDVRASRHAGATDLARERQSVRWPPREEALSVRPAPEIPETCRRGNRSTFRSRRAPAGKAARSRQPPLPASEACSGRCREKR